jgi:hypothetical protein
MGKLKSRYRFNNRLLKIYESKNRLRGIVYTYKWNNGTTYHLEKFAAASYLTKDEQYVKEQMGMANARPVDTDELFDANHRVIWNNNDYDEWEKCMLEDYPDEASREEENIEISYERYMEDRDNDLYDERANLDVPVDGVIVCFADLGLWDGHHQGAKKFGKYVKNILHSNCEFNDWFCDRYNVRCEASHHDGSNSYLYRVARDEEQADRLVQAIAFENMTEEEFRKATRSLRPYVAKVYGW